MKERDIVLSVIYTIITCGIYGIYWFICITDESLEATETYGTSGGLSFVFSLLTCGLYGLYWAYKLGERLDIEKQRRGLSYGSASTGILYLILDLFGLTIITLALAQSELNNFSRRSCL